MFEAIGNAILDGILYGIALLFYYIESALGRLLDKLYSMFGVFTGMTSVTLSGNKTYLPNVFFEDQVITAIYQGMAMIGICLLLAFALVSIIRKMFDSSAERVKQSYGAILVSTFKSALIILLMTAIILAVITATSILLDSVDSLFNSATELAEPATINFTDEDYGNMFRVLDTIANYSINQSASNRFNINILFNEISSDLQTLEASGMFRFSYEDAPNSWQYYLRKIYLSADIKQGIPVDQYNASVEAALTDCMYQIKYNSLFKPISKYSERTSIGNSTGGLGTALMLACSLNAAKNDAYNGNGASLTDNLRITYYNGTLDIFNRKQCEKNFNIRFEYWDHVVCVIVLVVSIISFVKILFNCVARIFNIVFLYLVSPAFISITPLDEGAKFRQWITAFVIQSCSIFGVFISVRLMMVFVPIILNGSLVLFENSGMNFLAKIIIVVGFIVTAEKASGIFTGILADNAGMQSIMAGDIGNTMAGKIYGLGSGVVSGVSAATGLSTIGHKLGKNAQIEHGGIIGAMRAWGTKGGAAGGGGGGKSDNKEKAQNAASEARKLNGSPVSSGANLRSNKKPSSGANPGKGGPTNANVRNNQTSSFSPQNDKGNNTGNTNLKQGGNKDANVRSNQVNPINNQGQSTDNVGKSDNRNSVPSGSSVSNGVPGSNNRSNSVPSGSSVSNGVSGSSNRSNSVSSGNNTYSNPGFGSSYNSPQNNYSVLSNNRINGYEEDYEIIDGNDFNINNTYNDEVKDIPDRNEDVIED